MLGSANRKSNLRLTKRRMLPFEFSKTEALPASGMLVPGARAVLGRLSKELSAIY